MSWFHKILNFYNKGLWSKEQVKKALDKGKITAEEYGLIIGEEEKA